MVFTNPLMGSAAMDRLVHRAVKIVIEDEAGRRTTAPFAAEEIAIGRATEGVAIRLTERNVSRRHARLFRLKGDVWVEDLGSLLLPVDMELYAGETGFLARSSPGTLETLKSAVRNKLPVICLVDLGFGIYRQPHYVTAIGFDDVHQVIIMHDGRTRDSVMPFKKFDRAWARAGRWMLVIKPQKNQDLP